MPYASVKRSEIFGDFEAKNGFSELLIRLVRDVLEGLAAIIYSLCMPFAQEAHQFLAPRPRRERH